MGISTAFAQCSVKITALTASAASETLRTSSGAALSGGASGCGSPRGWVSSGIGLPDHARLAPFRRLGGHDVAGHGTAGRGEAGLVPLHHVPTHHVPIHRPAVLSAGA